jgi:hypothetical protein
MTMAKTVTSLSAIENTATSEGLRPWKSFVDAKDESKLEQVHKLKEQIADYIIKQGQAIGIENLSIQHLMVLPEMFNRKVTVVWNTKKGEWFKYKDGDPVPSWLTAMGKAYQDYVYDPEGKKPNGRLVTAEMIASYRGRGTGGSKATSLDAL